MRTTACCADATADPATDAAQVQRQTASIRMLRETATKAATSAPAVVELRATAHKITIVVVDSKLNDGDTVGRSDEASRIVAAIERAIASKKEFGQVMMMHVDYVQRQAGHSDIVQSLDFTKAPSGSFVPHTT
jgi:hypothetical protein